MYINLWIWVTWKQEQDDYVAVNKQYQLCIVHQIRNSCKFVPYKDRKAICADLKKIYGAVNLDDAEYAKEEFREKWDKKYPNILKSWDKNWSELTVFFEYPPAPLVTRSMAV